MNQRTFLHIGFWLTYWIASSYIIADLGNVSYKDFSWAFRLWKAMSENAFFLILPILLFYGIFYFFLPKNTFQKNWIKISSIIAIVLLSVIAYRILVGYVVYPYIYHETYNGNLFGLSLLINSGIKIYTLVGLAGAIKMYRTREKQKQKEQELIKEKLESELHFLRAQINPHFFFNTLNNIYGLARKKSDHTAEVVMRLSKLMRFILYECNSKTIPLSKEVKVLEDYIELEKLRYDDRLEINFNKKVDLLNQPIAPLLLLPFVENSFKHGASEMRFKSKIGIDLMVEKGHLFFSIKNNKNTEHKTGTNGLGLKNVKRQLELIYPDQYQLDISESQNSFSVTLKIQLD